MENETNNFLNWVEIKNFKSIKDLRLDCKRVNVFIGKPNVGKSNILEGLGMLGAEYGIGKFMGGFARYETISDLFYDKDVINAVQIISDRPGLSAVLAKPSIVLNEYNDDFVYEYFIGDRDSAERIALSENVLVKGDEHDKTALGHNRKSNRYFSITKEGKISQYTGQGNMVKYSPKFVRKYDFSGLTTFTESSFSFLMPPNGENLFSVVNRDKTLKDEFAKLFLEQRLELVLSNYEQSFELQKREGHYVTKYPFFSIADTFRRFMFYITAIESNKNSVLIFEEPEVHSFPPYTQEMALRMVYDEDNQYFISTHSPYMLHPFIEHMDYKDLNVFVTYYRDYQTQVRALTEDEFRDILDYSTNVFFNLDLFTPDVETNKATA